MLIYFLIHNIFFIIQSIILERMNGIYKTIISLYLLVSSYNIYIYIYYYYTVNILLIKCIDK